MNQPEEAKEDMEKAISSKEIDDVIVAQNAVDVSEAYSPPRVVKMARTMGLAGGRSLDLKA